MAQPRTLFDKIWDSHVIAPAGEGTYLLYIDLHLCHEVTTPQAFEGLKLAGRKVRRPDATIAVADHNIPTSNRKAGIDEPESQLQVDTLERNVVEFGVPYIPIDSINQGIVHIIGPEMGLRQPGMTTARGHSHPAPQGPVGAPAIGHGRAGLVAPDEITFEYVKGQSYAPEGAAWEQALAYWKTLPSDPGAHFDKKTSLDAGQIAPHITWGTNPEQTAPITSRVPDPAEI